MTESKRNISLFLILTLVVGVVGQANLAEASASIKGKNIYYSYSVYGKEMGIMRYNVQSGKNREIVSCTLNGELTDGFCNVMVVGKYIYATWDQYYGSEAECNYIYRFSKDGAIKKKLAVGSLYRILGKYIYYLEEKETEGYGSKITETTEYMCKMKLNGKSKEKVLELSNVGWYGIVGGKFVYADNADSEYVYTETGNKIKRSVAEITETYIYTENQLGGMYGIHPTELYRKNTKTGKTNLVASFSQGICDWQVCGDYVMLLVITEDYNINVYCVSTDGEVKKKIVSWKMAG